MLRYYMTSQTRQSLIEESNRMIAMRAITNAARGRRMPAAVRSLAADPARGGDAPDQDFDASIAQGAFARLVADLAATSQASTRPARAG